MNEPTPESLHVADLKPTVTERDLFNSFRQYGAISIRVCRDDKTQESLGYAYVNFDSKENARRALEMLNHKEIDGRPCKIKWVCLESDQNARLLCVKNLDKRVDSKKLHEVFESCGEITCCLVIPDATTGESKGYGYIQFSTPADAQKALQEIDGKIIHVGDEGEKGQPICVRPCVEPVRPSKVPELLHPEKRLSAELLKARCTVRVENLGEWVTGKQLEGLFAPIGEIFSAKIVVDKDTNTSTGMGLVCFRNLEHARKAVTQMNNYFLGGKSLQVALVSEEHSAQRSEASSAQQDSAPYAHQPHPAQASANSTFISHSSETVLSAPTAVSGLHQELVNAQLDYLNTLLRLLRAHVDTLAPVLTSRGISSALATLSQCTDELVRSRDCTEDIDKITSSWLATNTRTCEDGIKGEESKGFGFVNFETHEGALRSMEDFADMDKMEEFAPELLHPKEDLYAAQAMNKSKGYNQLEQVPLNRDLYIKNLAESVTDKQLEELFAQFGEIVSTKIMVNEATGVKRGFGFVCFKNADDARKAITHMTNYLLEGNPLYVALAQPREVRRKQLEAQFTQRMLAPYPYGPYPVQARPMVPAGTRMPRGAPGYTGRGGFPGMNMAQRGRPQGAFPHPPGGRPVEADNSIRGRLKSVPDDHKFQFLGDTLFSLIKSEDGTDPHRIVGTLLKTYSGSTLEETVNRLVPLCEDPEKRAEAIQKLHLPPRQ